MALILDTDLLCVERGGRSYKWSGAELKGQVIDLSPIAQINGTLPIVVTQVNRDANISIRTASTSQSGATILTNTIDGTQTKALTPKGANDALALKANTNGSNATGTWGIDISGNAATSTSSTTATNVTNVRVDTESSTNTNRYVVFADGGGSSNRRMKVDGGMTYNPSSNTLTATTFKGNLNGTASSASSATNSTNAVNSTNATNVNVLADSSNSNRYLNFSSGTSGNTRIRAHGGLYYKPSTGTLVTSTINATTASITNLTVSNFSLSSNTDISCRDLNASRNVTASGNVTCRNLTASGNVNSASDSNLKEDIEVISGAVESLKQINGVNFTWKSSKEKSMGVIAQDVEKVFPDIVDTNDDGLKSVNYSGIIGALVEAVKELSARVEELEASK